jgi:hypothetical protein
MKQHRTMTEPLNPEFDEKLLNEDRNAWCQAYVAVWAQLSKGIYDRQAVENAADEHWQRSPQSDPMQMAAVEFTT